MIQYLSNRQEQRIDDKDANFMFDPLIHNDAKGMEKMNEIKTSIFQRLQKNQTGTADLNKLIIDPSKLGRYMNFKGASSQIARYIKQLDRNTKKHFVSIDPPFVPDNNKTITNLNLRGSKLKEKVMAQIQETHAISTIQNKNRDGLYYYEQRNRRKSQTPRIKLQSFHLEPTIENDQTDISRIHSCRKGKIHLKPLSKRNNSNSIEFQDTPRSIPLQPITRQQIYEMLIA